MQIKSIGAINTNFIKLGINSNLLISDKQISNKNNAANIEKYSIPAAGLICFTSNIKRINPYKKFDLNGKNILITGGTGTIGNQILESLLKDYNPNKITIFSRDELKQHNMKIKYGKNPKVEFIIGNIRDKESLKQAFKNKDVVIHTAAMKHVPICEENPEEAVKTNIDGVRNIISAAKETNVKNVLAISSDKAAAPANLYGATKYIGEKLFIAANKNANKNETKFSCVRLGNVLGSTGSIIPLFKEQSKHGNLKVTDKNMSRFFMTPKQATDLVLTGIESMNGGEIFIPKVKNAKIINLAHRISPNSQIDIIGTRVGEKLAEEFFTAAESHNTIEISDKYIILPENQVTNYKKLWKNSQKLPENYNYSSDNENLQMSEAELSKLIKQFLSTQ